MKIIAAAVCLTAASILPAMAAEVCPSGQVAIIRVSTLALGAQPAVDDGYKAFVKEFRDNSDITTEKSVCLPK